MAAANKQKVVLRTRDANAAFNAETTKKLEDLCLAEGISFSFKDKYIEEQNKELIAQGQNPHSLGSTEMGRITAASKEFVHGTTLQIPTTGYHTMEESASIESCEAFLTLLLQASNS